MCQKRNASLTEQLADFLTKADSSAIPTATLRRARYYFLDWLGSAIAGTQTQPGRIALDCARRRTGVGASVIGLDDTRSPEVAAFANGALSHIVEMDDHYRTQNRLMISQSTRAPKSRLSSEMRSLWPWANSNKLGSPGMIFMG